MKKVLVQGSFDIITNGHVKVFKFCKEHGDHLTVALNTDELLKSYKNRTACIPFQYKKEIIEAIRYVDEVIPADDFSPLELLKDYDVFAVADEWVHTKGLEIQYMLNNGKEVIYLPRFNDIIATSTIKQNIIDEHRSYAINGDKPKTAKDFH